MFKYSVLIVIFVINHDCNGFNKDRIIRLEIANNELIKKQLRYNQNSLLNFTERSQKYGYRSETHTIVTEDGYILKLFRMLKRPHCEKLKTPPVLLQHGLFLNAISYLDAGPRTALAFLLADQCLDVWCGNFRGTEYSRTHKNLNPDNDPEYWQFSFHEMGLYDLPAMVDYILNTTRSKNLMYIGYSQSMSAFVVLTSLRPDYVEKFAVAVGMAPGIWHQPSTDRLLRFGIHHSNLLYDIADSIGLQELFHTHSFVQELFQFFCQKTVAVSFCSKVLSLTNGLDTNSIAYETLSVMFAHVPDGVSIKNLAHIAQIMNSGVFQQYDYGKDNLKIYGEHKPPEYYIKNITVPVALMYSDDDHIVLSKDVIALSKLLPNFKRIYRMEVPGWTHLDFVWSQLIPKYLFPKIMESLSNYIDK